MFTISNSSSNGFEKIHLTNNVTNTTATILPLCGATLHSFSVVHNNSLLNIIDHYESAEDFATNVTAKGFKSCKMSPFACRIKNASYQHNGNSYTIEKFLLGSSAIHGLLYDAPFTLVAQSADEKQASITLQHQYRGIEKGFPFHYDCAVTYQLKSNNELVIITTITNKDDKSLPLQDGWHPYFSFGGKVDDLLLEFQSTAHVLFDEELVPTGAMEAYDDYTALKKLGPTSFDDCFKLNFETCQPMCVLRDPAQKIQLEIRPDKSYPYLQLYTPPHRKSIAIENLSAPPDCFNNGINLIELKPGETTVFTTSYTITTLK
jgi:aldose 1-epimerase